MLLKDKKDVLSGRVMCKKAFRYVAINSDKDLISVAEMISPSYTLFLAIFEEGKFIGAMTQSQILQSIQKANKTQL